MSCQACQCLGALLFSHNVHCVEHRRVAHRVDGVHKWYIQQHRLSNLNQSAAQMVHTCNLRIPLLIHVVISRGGLWRLLGTVTLNKSGRMLTEAVTSSPPLLSPHAAREDRSEIPIEIKVSALNRGLEFWWWLMSDDVRFLLFCSFLPLENQPRKNDQRSARNRLYRLCAELRAAAMKSWKRFLTFKYRPSSRLSHRFPLPTVQSVQIRCLTATCTKNQFSKKLGSKPITTKLTPSPNVSNSIDHLALWH